MKHHTFSPALTALPLCEKVASDAGPVAWVTAGAFQDSICKRRFVQKKKIHILELWRKILSKERSRNQEVAFVRIYISSLGLALWIWRWIAMVRAQEMYVAEHVFFTVT